MRCLSILLSLITSSTYSAILTVGPGKQFSKPSLAIAAANNGDTIEIDAGTYENDVATISDNQLTLRGIGGRAHLKFTGSAISNGKAIWVVSGSNTTIENIEFSGARVPAPDLNGSGIRQEGKGVTIRNCYFHDNQNGILTSNDTSIPKTSDIVIENSEFAHNGIGDPGRTHNMYIGNVRSFTLRNSYSHHAVIGHTVKSRAESNYILYNRIMDEDTGSASYLIDLPEGGLSYVIGNLLQKGVSSSNSTLIAYSLEPASNPNQNLYVVNNTMVNNRGSGTFVRGDTGTTSTLINNLFVGTGTELSGNGPTPDHNLHPSNPGLVNLAAYDYRLTSSSVAINAGVSPGTSLVPGFHYVHPVNCEVRIANGTIDVGAYEFNGSGGACGPSSPDGVPPAISWISPANSSTVSGQIMISADITDAGSGVREVVAKLGTEVLQTFAPSVSNRYSLSLNTATRSNGVYSISMTATDQAMNVSNHSVSVTFSNVTIVPDTSAPIVSFISPDGEIVYGVISAQINASDPESGISNVKIKLDGVTMADLTQAPYVKSIDTEALSDGVHTLEAIATNGVNLDTSLLISIDVRNTPQVGGPNPSIDVAEGGGCGRLTGNPTSAFLLMVVVLGLAFTRRSIHHSL